MKLEVGMYVRSKINGLIAKITDIEILCVRNPVIKELYTKDIRYILDNNLNRGFCESEKDSVKASNNIIDLIEVGDYVNGCYVEEVTKLYIGNGKYTKGVETSETQSYGWDKAIPESQIKSIVTKEQFESMQYKVD